MSGFKKQTIYLGLGSNQGDAAGYIQQALTALSSYQELEVELVSPFFRTEPQGFEDQPWFVNAVAQLGVAPDLNPEDGWQLLSQIENKMGRVRTQKWGPRIIDLDILLWGTQTWNSPTLTIPHPRLCQRAFVLVPLICLNPSIKIKGKTPEQWLQSLSYTLDRDVIYQSQF